MCLYMCVGTETLWPVLLLLNALPALLCCVVLPFLPESPRYLMLVRKDTKAAEKGEILSLAHRVYRFILRSTRITVRGHSNLSELLYLHPRCAAPKIIPFSFTFCCDKWWFQSHSWLIVLCCFRHMSKVSLCIHADLKCPVFVDPGGIEDVVHPVRSIPS